MSEPATGVQALLLASGRGSRFDASGRINKLCQRLPNGTTVIAASAANLLLAGLPVMLVAPHDARLVEALEGIDVTWCENPEPARGMGHSIALGALFAPDASGWLVALGDMPFVRANTIQRIVTALAQPGTSVAAPYYRGERGHPVGFARSMKTSLEGLDGDAGARSVLQDHAIARVETDDYGILRDIDRPQDLQQ